MDVGVGPGQAHSHGFSFIWVLKGERYYEYCKDDEIVKERLVPGDFIVSSFALKHRSVATATTIGSIAAHGYVLLRAMPTR